METWPPGITSREEYVEKATLWKEASSKDQKILFEEHGIRYSELLRLPYWNPVSYVVIDSMHGILLGLLRHHCRVLWGMNIRAVDGDGSRPQTKNTNVPSAERMLEAWEILRRGTNKDLEKLGARVLKQLCIQANVAIGGHKTHLQEVLKELVRLARISTFN